MDGFQLQHLSRCWSVALLQQQQPAASQLPPKLLALLGSNRHIYNAAYPIAPDACLLAASRAYDQCPPQKDLQGSVSGNAASC